MEAEPVLHVWQNTDSDLIDLTVTISTPTHNGNPATKKSEVIHTTSTHPFLTTNQGFVAAGKLHIGMHLVSADGGVGVVDDGKVVQGTKTMYNLEVAQDHTFAVSNGEWVVHNRCNPTLLGNRLLAANPTLGWAAGQNPHHIIPCALQGHALILLAGFDINDASNGRIMWDYAHKAQALAAGEPYHANAPGYLRLATKLLNDEYQRLTGPGLPPPTAADAMNAVSAVIAQLNGLINFQEILGVAGGAACPLPGL